MQIGRRGILKHCRADGSQTGRVVEIVGKEEGEGRKGDSKASGELKGERRGLKLKGEGNDSVWRPTRAEQIGKQYMVPFSCPST
jgi:hypothetical protein